IVLTENCRERLAAMRSEVHRRGFLSVRQLLRVAGYAASEVYYDAFGKPHLTDGNHISVTHSFTFSGIIISGDREVGIDIEKQRDKIRKIADKFVGYEWNYLSADRLIEKLTLIWCAKESLYKSFGVEGLSFKRHCSVIPFDPEAQQTKAWIRYGSRMAQYDIRFFSFEGFSCAYALKL
ncbi:MAG: 4'-phosphopantetheinyl transferase superfamily protein, partial [Sinomicrobium sp.]|nr:4'-phosphopantetheinyl transferase superfamily protein [Sinomicrobium sp.]